MKPPAATQLLYSCARAATSTISPAFQSATSVTPVQRSARGRADRGLRGMCRACPPAPPTASGRSLDDPEAWPGYHRGMPAVTPDLLGPQGEFGHREHLRLAW